MAIGVPLGLLAGFYNGFIRGVIMRLVDIFMSFPALAVSYTHLSPAAVHSCGEVWR